ncbi:MAG: hypothetical protein NTW21_37880 [Verrucomicrobia bacterium]|nr:hypothetical protein [Verrucomicrobiota bacterium]
MKTAYKDLQQKVNRCGFGPECHSSIRAMIKAADTVLSKCDRLPLTSTIPGKAYFALEGKSGLRSRPINSSLFASLQESADRFLDILNGNRRAHSSDDITAAVYTVAVACCAAIDVISKSDRKTQGTLFEWLCAALIRATLRVCPTRSLEVLNLDLRGKLPTDFIFDMGSEKPKFHLPVKTSTRERIIQVWAHQRVLDGVYGAGRFLAMPIILTETKLDAKTLAVTEICLPWQWRLYQMHIASLWNVCYLDAPGEYLKLNNVFPPVRVVTIGDMLAKDGHIEQLLLAHGLPY